MRTQRQQWAWWDLNPHSPCEEADFKSAASAIPPQARRAGCCTGYAAGQRYCLSLPALNLSDAKIPVLQHDSTQYIKNNIPGAPQPSPLPTRGSQNGPNADSIAS